MTTTEKTPIVIIHEGSWRTPKLPAKHRYEYKTVVDVEAGTTKLTVSVMKTNPLVKFFLGRDRILGTLSRETTNEGVITASITCTDMEIALAEKLFPTR